MQVRQQRVEHGEPVAHAAGRAGQVDDDVSPATPATARVSAAVGVAARPAARIASATPGSSRSSTARGRLGGAVLRVDAGAAGRQDQRRGARPRHPGSPPRCRRRRHDDRRVDRRSRARCSQSTMQRAGAVRRRCRRRRAVEETMTMARRRGRASGRCRDEAAAARLARSSAPCLPPVFSTRRMSASTAAGSTALIMSCSVSPAIATAVSASISTPVFAVTATVAVMLDGCRRPGSNSIVTASSGSRWRAGSARSCASPPRCRRCARSPARRPSAARRRAPARSTSAVVVEPAARDGDAAGHRPWRRRRSCGRDPASSRWLSSLIAPKSPRDRPPARSTTSSGHVDEHVGCRERRDQMRARSRRRSPRRSSVESGARAGTAAAPESSARRREPARGSRAGAAGSPASSRSSGATNSSKLSWLLTGLPGKHTTGTPR